MEPAGKEKVSVISVMKDGLESYATRRSNQTISTDKQERKTTKTNKDYREINKMMKKLKL